MHLASRCVTQVREEHAVRYEESFQRIRSRRIGRCPTDRQPHPAPSSLRAWTKPSSMRCSLRRCIRRSTMAVSCPNTPALMAWDLSSQHSRRLCTLCTVPKGTGGKTTHGREDNWLRTGTSFFDISSVQTPTFPNRTTLYWNRQDHTTVLLLET